MLHLMDSMLYDLFLVEILYVCVSIVSRNFATVNEHPLVIILREKHGKM